MRFCMSAERQAELAAAAAQKAEAEEGARRAEEALKAKRAAEEEVLSARITTVARWSSCPSENHTQLV